MLAILILYAINRVILLNTPAIPSIAMYIYIYMHVLFQLYMLTLNVSHKLIYNSVHVRTL